MTQTLDAQLEQQRQMVERLARCRRDAGEPERRRAISDTLRAWA